MAKDTGRTAALLRLIDPALDAHDMTDAELVRAAGLPAETMRNLRRGSVPGAYKLAHIARVLGIPLPEIMAASRTSGSTPPAAMSGGRGGERIDLTAQRHSVPTSGGDRLPLLRAGNMRDDIIGSIERPAFLTERPEAYGIIILDDAVAPILRRGQTAYIDPSRPAVAGDLVRIRLAAGGGRFGILAEGAEGEIAITRPTAAEPEAFRADSVSDVHLVVGALYLRA